MGIPKGVSGRKKKIGFYLPEEWETDLEDIRTTIWQLWRIKVDLSAIGRIPLGKAIAEFQGAEDKTKTLIGRAILATRPAEGESEA